MNPTAAMSALAVIVASVREGRFGPVVGPLKTAIDSVGREWQAKPVGFVCYGGLSGGLRAVEQLRVVFAELHTITIRDTVSFPGARQRFDDHGMPREPDAVNAAARALLDQLAWWAHTLQHARTAHPYGT